MEAPDDHRGLTASAARDRLAAVGPNEIRRSDGTSAWRLFAGQFASPLVLLLVAACTVSAALGEVTDALAIGAILLLNGVVGFAQEYRAQNAVLALRAMTAPRARVIRDGHGVLVPATQVVPDDLLVLEPGDVVAADARLVEAHDLTVNEASLTGESAPVRKDASPDVVEAPLAERFDTVFMGTAVAAGAGVARVVGTGMRTELGAIATLIETAEEGPTPLQRQLAQVGRSLLWLCLGVVGVVAAVGLAQGQPWLAVLLMAVPLAVAAVPEGLPAVVTVALAVGVQRMAARNVLVRRLAAVETLGAATVICTDKTGTLTTGEMAVRELWGPDPAALVAAAAACCDAEVDADGRGVGDATEVAILRAALEHGIRRADIEANNPRVDEHPFDGERMRMSVRRADGRLYVKGAIDRMLPLCASGTEGAADANADLAARGLRVLAVAVGEGSDERDLHLLGVIGVADPPRAEAIEAVARARRAGVAIVMLTGDHPTTATAIAREIGLLLPTDDPAQRVHARVTPADKLRIVREWKARGHVVAMTGDGVNDAPSLREAHIGIAMGRTGTEVTREAADMVLADDDFASIVAAIHEGRGIWENIRKTVVYLLAGNFGELVLVLGATLAGYPLPLLPLHLLWVNLVTDGLPALALVMDPAPPDALDHPPRRPDAPMLGPAQWRFIALWGCVDAAVVFGVFAWTFGTHGIEAARNLAFSTLVFVELFRVFAARDPRRTLFEVGALTNPRLIGVVVASVLVQVALHHIPVIQTAFQLAPLGLADLALTVGLGLVPVSIIEVGKLVLRRRR